MDWFSDFVIYLPDLISFNRKGKIIVGVASYLCDIVYLTFEDEELIKKNCQKKTVQNCLVLFVVNILQALEKWKHPVDYILLGESTESEEM